MGIFHGKLLFALFAVDFFDPSAKNKPAIKCNSASAHIMLSVGTGRVLRKFDPRIVSVIQLYLNRRKSNPAKVPAIRHMADL